ncbi:hypothetical protein [Cellulomonas sp. URHD0024]|uniref:hypothetical protein n=1 Tax=Cellulomonas sp. URHD0024 TaxID=1302620 RepID=UPI0003F9EB1B|nr:hypothetical protein [Cellulomonas sp. URHD0024]
MIWLEVVGWAGSALVIVSLMQARVLRFRVLNLIGALLAAVYNAIIGVWPFAAMNAVIVVIDVYWLVKLLRERHDETVYSVVEVDGDDAYLQHVLQVHQEDIAKFQPSFTSDGTGAAFLVQRGDETVGVVVVRDAGGGVGRVELDYVTPRFRDFTPGEFVYRHSGVFAAHGLRSLVVDALPQNQDYLQRVGFRPGPAGWTRAVDVAA